MASWQPNLRLIVIDSAKIHVISVAVRQLWDSGAGGKNVARLRGEFVLRRTITRDDTHSIHTPTHTSVDTNLLPQTAHSSVSVQSLGHKSRDVSLYCRIVQAVLC